MNKHTIWFFALLIIFNVLAENKTYNNYEPEGDIKLLVLIIASDDLPVYPELQKIWKTYMHLDPQHVEAYFIRADPHLDTLYKIEDDIIWSRSVENLIPGLTNKTLLSLEALWPRIKNGEFDYILRTNLSSFYVFPRFLEVLKNCPTEKFYFGSSISWDARIGCGCGFIMTPDLVELVLKHKSFFMDNTSDLDDVIFGQFFIWHRIPLVQHARIDFYSMQDWHYKHASIPEDAFHFRIKNEPELRLTDDMYMQKELLKKFYGKTI